MIRKLEILLLFLACTNYVCSQQDSIHLYQIQYKRTLDFNDGLNPFIIDEEYTKFIEFNRSLYARINKSENSKTIIEDSEDDTFLTFVPSGKNTSVVFKNYEDRTLYSKHEVAYKYFVVEDSLDIFNWEIMESSKEILGFTCQMATMNFRGRDYVAWFTTALPIGGPWKYDGLPGMILELNSIDNFISYEATGLINKIVHIEAIENPFNLKKSITWDEFKALYKKKAIELTSFTPNENTLGITSSRGGIEMYIDEDDIEYNEALKRISNN